MSRKATLRLVAVVAVLAAIGLWLWMRTAIIAPKMDPAQLVGKSAPQVIETYGRPDMVVPSGARGEADWFYNQGVMGAGMRLRVRNNTVVSAAPHEND